MSMLNCGGCIYRSDLRNPERKPYAANQAGADTKTKSLPTVNLFLAGFQLRCLHNHRFNFTVFEKLIQQADQ